MELLFVLAGMTIGLVIAWILRGRERIHGVVHVDHKTNQCTFEIRSADLANHKRKIAVFVINHNADLSRKKQPL